MFKLQSILSLATALLSFEDKGPLVHLGYSSYEGIALSNGQNQFLGIRFAAPPLEDLRFRRPVPPLHAEGIQPAKEFAPICLGVKGLIDLPPPPTESEDCLYLNVWAPSNATKDSKLPVFFWIPGGGYNIDSDPNYNGSALVQATGNNMIFVNINHRLGPYGFLASQKLRQDGDLNVGLLDQRFALKWVQQYIELFGGDPKKVVILGDSAGAGSVALQLTAYGGRDDGLIAGGFGLSPYFPTQLRVSELEWQFDLFTSRAGCGSAENSLQCLRNKTSVELQAINIGMPYPGRVNQSLFPFTPTIDDDFIPDFPLKLFDEGRFLKVPAIFGTDTDEGTIFTINANSQEEADSFLKDQYPQLSEEDLKTINKLYPPQVPSPFPGHTPFFASAAAAFGEATFICPGLRLSSIFSKYTKTWSYRYNVLTSFETAAGLGVVHTGEIPVVFGPGQAGTGIGGFDDKDLPLVPILQAYYTSFVRSLDPNAHPVEGSVRWPEFDPNSNQRLLIEINSTRIETVPKEQRDRCAFWKDLSLKIEQ